MGLGVSQTESRAPRAGFGGRGGRPLPRFRRPRIMRLIMGPKSLRGWLLAALLPSLSLPSGAAPQAPDNRSCRTDYVLEAVVEPDTRELRGKASITWTNRTEDSVSDAWFHLHLNAYSSNYSTHLWESKGELRGHKIKEGWGWQRVTSIRVGDRELIDTLQWQRPDDEREEDFTVFSVRLPEAVPPGGSIVIDLDWDSLIPRVRRRTGMKGDFIFLAHWFPKLGVYEGGAGWNCHQFHMNSEFYADFGTYDVTLDLPDRYALEIPGGYEMKVGASGVPVGAPEVADGRVKVRYAAPGNADRLREDPVATGLEGAMPLVHGFAWTADPDYEVTERKFVMMEWIESQDDPLLQARLRAELAAAAAAFGVDPEEFGLRSVEVEVLIQPERQAQADRHWNATCAALFFYGIWFGEYPYSKLTVVDPAWGARAAGGMEYPTIFTCGTSLFTSPATYTPESVTVHEAGHQFFYGLVGNNEYEAAWLDEGLNSYADSEVLFRMYGPRRTATRYSSLPVWGVPTAPDPASTGTAGILTGQGWFKGKAGKRASESSYGPVSPLKASPFIDWWRDQPWLTFGESLADPRWSDRSSYLREPTADPIRTDTFSYLSRTSFATNSYSRPAIVLRSLPAIVGETAFRRGMRHYAREWRYRHPYPDDFYASFQEGSQTDVQWYFDELFEGTGTVDWSVSVSQVRTPTEMGFRFADGEWVEVSPDGSGLDPQGDGAGDKSDDGGPEGGTDSSGQEASIEGGARDDEAPDEADESETLEESDAPLRYDVVVRRRGTLCLPLTIEVSFEDESIQQFQWTREQQLESTNTWWRLPIVPGPTPIERVLIDPERRYYLDTDMSDNQWYRYKDAVVPARWGERAFTQYVHLLHWFSSLGG